ncbi:MAG: Gfo/Idh/MocA family oxidoreductase [Verrucomicrobia bacterium]|nr:Gfo/Idh/MocA family oxidoreductase [Verrucomicrobiota bacterium]
MRELRFAILGTGFWARYQLAAWRELQGARCVALFNRTRAKAEKLAQEFGVPAVYDDAEELFRKARPDFVDIITDVGTHRQFAELAAAHKTPVICQKPLAPTLAEARAMLAACSKAGVPLFVHENWRWQAPLRELKKVLDSGVMGRVFRARVTYSNSFPVFDNQPFLKELEQFILTDIGTHILDTARMLFGEARTLFCRTTRVHPDIRGEDVATVMLGMASGATVTCEMSYASRVEHDRFPETFVFIEGERGSAELGPDYWIRVTTAASGTLARRCPPPFFAWADPRYALAQTAGVACNANLLGALQGVSAAETTGEDNLKTLSLVFGSYESAMTGQAIRLPT